MRYENAWLAIVCTVTVFFLLELAWGEGGIYAYSQRTAVVETLHENVSELRKRNSELSAERHALLQDTDLVLNQAAAAGYVRGDQGLIKIDGDYSSQKTWEVGRIQYIPPAPSGGRPVRGGIALIIGLSVYLFSTALIPKRRRNLHLETGHQSPLHQAM